MVWPEKKGCHCYDGGNSAPVQPLLVVQARKTHGAPYFLTLSHGPWGCGSLRLERPSPCTAVRFRKRQTLLIKSCLCSSARTYGRRTGWGQQGRQLPTEGGTGGVFHPPQGKEPAYPKAQAPLPSPPGRRRCRQEGNWRKALITGAPGSAPAQSQEKEKKGNERELAAQQFLRETVPSSRRREQWVETAERPREPGRGDGAARPPARERVPHAGLSGSSCRSWGAAVRAPSRESEGDAPSARQRPFPWISPPNGPVA